MRRIGVLTIFSEADSEPNAWLKVFQHELQKLGWEPGRNIQFETRLAGADAQRLQTGAAELIAMKPDVIFAATAPALAALARETRATPIVFVQVSDPVKLGFVSSLARPGGNMTGIRQFRASNRWQVA